MMDLLYPQDAYKHLQHLLGLQEKPHQPLVIISSRGTQTPLINLPTPPCYFLALITHVIASTHHPLAATHVQDLAIKFPWLRDVAVYCHFAISTFPVEIVIKSSAFILEYLLQLPIKSASLAQRKVSMVPFVDSITVVLPGELVGRHCCQQTSSYISGSMSHGVMASDVECPFGGHISTKITRKSRKDITKSVVKI
ncbi:hypothetical protein Tco_0266407 [Tanacetum coccineum]